jgi:formylglycine-generating enzyme required for sulfatase activity
MLETLLSLGSVSSSVNSVIDLYKNVSGVFKGKDKNQYLERIADSLERLSDNILYAPNMQVVQDVTKTRQQQIEDLKEARMCLESVQQVLGEEILSSAMILTPDKMQNALAKNPWEVLIDVRPVNSVTPPNNPDLVPVAFYHNGMHFIGWQMRGTLPILFDCQFEQLWTPGKEAKSKIPSSFRSKKEETPHFRKGGYGGISGEEFEFEVVTVDAKGNIINRRRHTATQHIERIKELTFEMVYIPGGSFMMGSPEDEGYKSEKPQHKVTIEPFYMSKYLITQQQWQAIMGNDPSHFKGKNHPVECVSWQDTVAFCKKLAKLTHKTYRLPTEAEWEYACRAGTTTPFYFGETITTELANYDGYSTYGSGPKGVYREATTDVGDFPPNAFGLYDMHGNVWEWCADPWHDNYKNAPNDGRIWDLEKNYNENRVLRGGSRGTNPINCRATNRYWINLGGRNVGFRVALTF